MNKNESVRAPKDLPTEKPAGPNHKAEALANQPDGTRLRADAAGHPVAGAPLPVASKNDGSPGGANAPKSPM